MAETLHRLFLIVVLAVLSCLAHADPVWENPIPAMTSSSGVTAAGGVAWVVGPGGLVLRRSVAGVWSRVETGSTVDLTRVWASSSNNVVAVGAGGKALQWNGTSWTERNTTTAQFLSAVHGSAANNVYAAGGFGNVVRWNGVSWSTVATNAQLSIGTMGAVWVFGPDDVYLADGLGKIFHCSSGCQSAGGFSVDGTVPSSVVGFFGQNPGEFYALDTGGHLYQRITGIWTEIAEVPGPGPTPNFLWGTSDRLFTVGGTDAWVFDGATWSPFREYELVGRTGWTMGGPEDDLLAVGDGIYSSPGSGWRQEQVGTVQRITSLARAGDELAATADLEVAEILNRDDGVWNTDLLGLGGGLSFAAASQTSYYVAGQNAVYHWNGTTWNRIGRGSFTDLWRSSSGHLVGSTWDGHLAHWDGTHWHSISTPASNLMAVWGTSHSSVWTVGNGGKIIFYGGSTAEEEVSNTLEDLEAVHGAGGEVFAGGDSGTVLKRQIGGTWQDLGLPTSAAVKSLWAEAADSVWVVASGLRHWNGSSWSLEALPGSGFIPNAVWGSASNRIFVVGSHGRVMEWDGFSWSELVTGVDATISLYEVAGAANVLLVAGLDVLAQLDQYGFELTGQWKNVILPNRSLEDIWWDDTTDYRFAVGHMDAFHNDGTQWRTATEVEDTGSDSVAADRLLNGVWGRSHTEVIAVGRQRVTQEGSILLWDGVDWVEDDVPTYELFDIDGKGSAVIAVGANGLIVSAPDWIPASTPVSDDLLAIDVCPGGEVWVVGEDGVILHSSDGIIWEEVESGTTRDILSVACLSSDSAWAGGENLLHWNGIEWLPAAQDPLGGARSLAASPLGIHAGGDSGVIVRLQEQTILFADGFESGDTSGWSATVP